MPAFPGGTDIEILERRELRYTRSTLFVCSTDDPVYPSIAIKAYPNPPNMKGWLEYSANLGLSEALSPNASLRALKVLGWTRQPATLWTEFVPGTDLHILLSDPARVLPPTEAENVRAWFASAGHALRLYHTATKDPVLESLEIRATVAEDLARLAKLVLRQGRYSDAFLRKQEVVKRYQDFDVHNLRVGDDARLYVLDPPTKDEYAFPHRDIGRFVVGINRPMQTALWRPYGRRARELAVQFAQVFMDSYSEGCRISGAASDHRQLIAIYEMSRQVLRIRSAVRDRRLTRVYMHLRLLRRAREITAGETADASDQDSVR